MTATLTVCPHGGKPLARSPQDLQPSALAVLRSIAEMGKPEVETDALAAACRPQ